MEIPDVCFCYISITGIQYETKEELDLLRLAYINSTPKELIFDTEGGYISRGPIARIIRAEIAKKNLFDEGFPIGEDVLWNMRLINKCERVCISKQIWYGYYIHSNSAIRKYYGNRIELAEKYISRLAKENEDFIQKHNANFGRNTVIEFYCILKYDLMSSKCKLSVKQKNEYAKIATTRIPWKEMYNLKTMQRIPIRFIILLLLVKINGWQLYLRISM